MEEFRAAEKLIHRGEFEQAVRVYGRLIEEGSQRVGALGHRAWLLKSMGRTEEALRDYEVLVAEQPDDLNAAALRAEMLRRLGRGEEASSAAVAVLGRDPMNATALGVLRSLQEARGESGLAEDSNGPLRFEDSRDSRSVNAIVDALESDSKSYPTSVNPAIGRFLHDITRMVRPRLALETGCYVGYSTLCIAQALEENGLGHLHSFDLFLDLKDYHSPVLGECSDARQVVEGHLERAGLAERVTLHGGDSSTGINSTFGGSGDLIDFAFIDGDHTVRGCLRDWKAVDALMREGGIVLLHDTNPEGCGWLGPRALLESLGREADAAYHWLNLPTPEGFGLALVQKRSKSMTRWRANISDLVADWFHRRTSR